MNLTNANTNDCESQATIEGILEKKGIIGFWIKKYCILIGNKFFIYKKKGEKKPEIELIINSSVCTEIIDTSSNKFKISQLGNNDSIFLQAKTANLMMEWILDLRACSFRNQSMSMEMFNILSVLGRGEYGKVMLCQQKDTQELFAIKTVHKKRLVRENKIQTILNERSILASINNPFIISLKYAFQTDTKFYLCLDYAPGGDLFHLLKCGPLPIQDVKLYIAELSLAINELHSKGIIYRDLKPENILFDKYGHIRLTDFGLSKVILDAEKTKTFCGTSDYMAPEIIRRNPYGKEIDWWGVGVVGYEMLYGEPPFASANRQRMYSNIVSRDPFFENNTDPDLKLLLSSLMEKDPKKRGNFETVKKSKFFNNFDFDAAYNKKISPSKTPELSDHSSTQNFDQEFTQERAFDSLPHSVSSPNKFVVPNFSFTCIGKFTSDGNFLTGDGEIIAPSTFEPNLTIETNLPDSL